MPCNDGALGGTAFNPSTYRRIIQLLDTDRSTVLETLCDYDSGTNVVERAEFEWLRQGGCGAGSFTLSKEFDDTVIETGHYIKCLYSSGNSWYLGRVEEVQANEPSGQTVRTYGLISLLNDLPVGGLGSGDCRGPHLFAPADNFPNDPDRAIQSWDIAVHYSDLVQYLYDGYILPETGIGLDAIESPALEIDLAGMVFRGEEMVGQVLRALALVQYGASYGVDPNGNFFFLNPRSTGLARFRQGSHCTSLTRSSDRSLLVNRVYLTGDNIYEQDIFTQGLINTLERLLDAISGGDGVKPYRFQKAYCDEASIALWGPKTRHIHLPWIRDDNDAQVFIDEFLAKYATPLTRYTFETIPQGGQLYPWLGYVCLQDSAGNTLSFDQFDRVGVTFNEAPYFQITTGPEDIQFPEPPERQRWELPNGNVSSDQFSFSTTLTGTETSSDAPSSNAPSSDAPSSDATSQSSDATSAGSARSSTSSDAPSSDAPSSDATSQSSDATSAGSARSSTSSDAPSSDVPSSDVTSSDVPSSDATSQSSDVPSSDVTSSDVPSSDVTSSDVPSSDVTSSDVPSSDVTSSDVPSSDVTSSDVPSSDVTSSDVPSSDVTSSDVPSSDVTSSDVPSSDVTSSDVPSSDVTSSDASSSDDPGCYCIEIVTDVRCSDGSLVVVKESFCMTPCL